jgi:hypothetical protein
MPIQDGFGFSPDGGEFEIRNNTAYWEDGDITENFNTAWVRWMPATNGKEHYADWTDEKRAAVKAERDGKHQAADAALKGVHYVILTEDLPVVSEGPSFYRSQRRSQRSRCMWRSAGPACGWPSPRTTRPRSASTVHD